MRLKELSYFIIIKDLIKTIILLFKKEHFLWYMFISFHRPIWVVGHICVQKDNHSIETCPVSWRIYQLHKNDSMSDVQDCCKIPLDIVELSHLCLDTYILWDSQCNQVHLDAPHMSHLDMVNNQANHLD